MVKDRPIIIPETARIMSTFESSAVGDGPGGGGPRPPCLVLIFMVSKYPPSLLITTQVSVFICSRIEIDMVGVAKCGSGLRVFFSERVCVQRAKVFE